MRSLCASGRGWPKTFDPNDRGMAIEDLWPSLFAGAARLGEAGRKLDSCSWAAEAIALWEAEAEQALAEAPVFVTGKTGGRGYFDADFQPYRFDPHQCETVHASSLSRSIPPTEETLLSWRL